jgi:hypothetical protein
LKTRALGNVRVPGRFLALKRQRGALKYGLATAHFRGSPSVPASVARDAKRLRLRAQQTITTFMKKL